jgi:hypothetical protein
MTTQAERNNPEYWRKRAEQIRAKAQTMTVPCDADMLYEIAKEYEFIAELTERPPQPKS